jgi:hypothetical protein
MSGAVPEVLAVTGGLDDRRAAASTARPLGPAPATQRGIASRAIEAACAAATIS